MNFKDLLRKPKAYTKLARKTFIRLIYIYAYKGDVVVCKNCNWHGKKFFNGECPNCKSLPRTRLIPFAIDYFNLCKPQLKVLHVAPNKTEYWGVKTKLSNVLQYDKMDIRPVKNINLVEDLTNLSLTDNSYDLVVVWHVFEHIIADKKAISEVYRILKPKGVLLMSVPIFPVHSELTYEDSTIQYKDYERVHGHSDHCRSCGLDYYKRFEARGFNSRELKVNNQNVNDILKFGLSKNHVVWCFTK